MADLGNLYFDLMLRDLTQQDLAKIKSKLIKALKLPVTIDTSGLKTAIERAVKGADVSSIQKDLEKAFKNADASQIKANIQNAIGAAGNSRFRIQVGIYKNDLVKNIKDALSQHDFKINVVVDKATARQAVQDALRQIGSWNGKYTADDLRAVRAQAAQQVAASRVALDNAKAQLALARAQKVASSQTGLHLRASTALGRSMGSNIRIAGELKNQFAALFSIYAVQGFLKKVIEVGGELEKQRLAMDAILGDKGQSTQITNQLASLAVRSPFGVLQLNSFAKQLTAYTIPYNELYDTMKRLADISAAVGVDMGRIVLAYGQIRAAKFLKGTELRQLTEANIPMVDMLAKKFTELEGRIVSAGDIMDMISKKKITFEDVKDVLWEITGEGGMFYNMQEKLSESVSAKWKNLGDAMDLMYGQIANSTSGILKWIPEFLTDMTRQFKTLIPMIGTATTVWLSHKAVMGVVNKVYSKGALQAMQFGKQQLAEKMRLLQLATSYRTLTAEEQQFVKNKNRQIFYQMKEAVATGMLTKEKGMLMIATGKLTGQEARLMAAALGVRNAQLVQLQSASRLKIAYMHLAVVAKSVGNALKGFFTSPWTWVTIGLEAITALVSKIASYNEKMREMKEAQNEHANEGYRNLSDFTASYVGMDPKNMKNSELQQAIDEMTQKLKDYSSTAGNTLKQMYEGQDGKPLKLAEQYDVLTKALQETTEAYRIMAESPNLALNANDRTNHGIIAAFGTSFMDEVEDFAELSAKTANYFRDFVTKHIVAFQNAIDAVKREDSQFAQAVQGLSVSESLSKIAESPEFSDKWLLKIKENLNVNAAIMNEFNVWARSLGRVGRKQREDLVESIDEYVGEIKKGLKEAHPDWDLSNLTQEQKAVIREEVNSFLQQIKGITPELQQWLNNEILQVRMNVEVGVTVSENPKAKDWKSELAEDLPSMESVITASSSTIEAYDQFAKDYKEAKENIAKIQSKYDAAMAVQEEKRSEVERQVIEEMDKNVKVVEDLERNKAKYMYELEEKKKKTASNKDAQAEAWRNEIDMIKKAYAEYKKFAELKGEAEAMDIVKKSGIFPKGYQIPTTIEQYRKAIEGVLSKVTGNSQERQKLRVNINELLLNIDHDTLKEEAQRKLKEIEEYISQESANWDIYGKVFKATGDRDLAKKAMAAFSSAKVWDGQAEALRDKLKEMMNGVEITDWDMGEEQAKETLGYNEDLLKLYQAIQKQLRENGKEQVNNAVSAVTATMTQAQQLEMYQKRLAELQAKQESDPDTFGIDAEIEQVTKKISELQTELFSLSPLYEQIFGDMTYQTYGAVKAARELAQELVKTANSVKDKDGKVIGYDVSYDTGEKDENGQAIIKTLRILPSLYDRLKNKSDDLYKTMQGKNPFATLIEDLKSLKGAEKGEKGEIWNKILKGSAQCMDQIGGVTDALSEMFDALGDEGTAEVFKGISQGLSSISNIASGFANGGIIGGAFAIATEGIGLLTSIFAHHDKSLQKIIENSAREIKALQNLYSQIDAQLEYSLGSNSELYKQRRNALADQLGEVRKQRNAELEKKKTDQDALLDYDNQIKELEQQIKDFAEDLIDELYGINLKDWASELGDTLYDAWKKGEDGVEAFRNKVGEMMGDVMNEILKIKILQPMMDDLETMLFGENGVSGMFGADFELDPTEVKSIGDYLMGLANTVDSYSLALDQIEEYLQQYGVSLKDSDSSNSLSAGIQSVTEDTADLLASYVNAMRADVAMKREFVRLMAQEQLPQISAIASAQLTELRAIAQSTLANAKAAEEIRDLLKNNTNPGKGFKIA